MSRHIEPIGALRLADLIEKELPRDCERPPRCTPCGTVRPLSVLARVDPPPEPIREPAHGGAMLDVVALARHFGCGMREAIERAAKDGLETGERTVVISRRGRNRREMVRFWIVPSMELAQ